MKDDAFREIEGKLYNLFKTQKRIDKLRRRCEFLEQHKEMVIKDIKDTNISLDVEMNFGINYSSLSVQSSGNGDSCMDKGVVAAINKLEKEWIAIRTELVEKRREIRKLEKNIYDLKVNIDLLEKGTKEFIHLKYKEEMNFDEIAEELHISKRTAFRRRKDLILDIISSWEGLVS